MNQVILLYNKAFESVFHVKNSETLFDGISLPIFEIYMFQELKVNNKIKQYKLIDSIDLKS